MYFRRGVLVEGSGSVLYGTTINGGFGDFGTIFKVKTDGTGFAVLKSAVGNPIAGLLRGRDGALYGTGYQNNTVFKINTDGTGFNVLHAGITLPSSPLIQDSDGTLYGTTSSGGIFNNGTVFKINTDGTGFVMLHSFRGSVEGSNPYYGLIKGSNGALYGTTRDGGSRGLGTVFKVNTDGTGFTVLHNFIGSDGNDPYGRIIQGGGGTYYGGTWFGGIIWQLVDKQTQTISFDPLANKVYGDTAFTLNATASSGFPVSYSASGNCSVDGVTVTLISAGSCTITASQSGNANYYAAASVSQSFSIDKATPVITWPKPESITVGTPLSATQLNATVNTSGVLAYNPAAGAVLNVGTNQLLSVDFTPTDSTDYNPASATMTIDVADVACNVTGFSSPVDNLPVANTVKAGSAIPAKFSLCGDQGLNIFASGFPVSSSTSCNFAAPTDPIEQTVTAGGSSLSYDSATGLYNYVWKTDKTWVGSCRQLVLKFTNGSTLRANFQFTK